MTNRLSLRDARTAVLITFLLVVFVGRFPIIDDAYIVFRYATNLATHHGLVFNAGERVEGATSALWTIYLALWAFVGANLETVAVLSALVCVLVAALRTVQTCRVLELGEWASGAAVVALLVAPGFVPALANGLEGALYAAILAEMIYRMARGQLTLLGPLGILLFATRPEGLAVAAAFVVALWRYPGRTDARRDALVAGAWLGMGAAAITAARLWYFGSPLPNSVVAKSYPLATYVFTPVLASGAYYVARFAVAYAWLTIPAAVALYEFRTSGAPARQRAVVGVSLFSLGVAGLAAVRNGGDWMPGFRLCVRYAPALAVAATAGVQALRARAPILPRWAFALLVIPLAAMSLDRRTENVPPRQLAHELFAESRIRAADEDPTIQAYGRAARSLGPYLSSGDLVSAEAVGLLVYRLPAVRVHDPCGLIDPFIARRGRPAPPYGRMMPAYTVFDSRPSVMLWHDPRHLESLDPDTLNRSYLTVCLEGCDALRRGPTWSATIAMVRRDRQEALRPALRDGVAVEFSAAGLRLSDVGAATSASLRWNHR